MKLLMVIYTQESKLKNKDVAKQAEKELPGVTSQHLSDYGQFVRK